MGLALDSLASEIGVRFVLLILFCYLDVAEPFYREIHREELWLYSNPHKPDTFSSTTTVVLGFGVPPVVMAVCCALRGLGVRDFIPACLGSTLSSLLTVVLNNIVKLLVGRPRPDFSDRCFPGGRPDSIPTHNSGGLQLDCTGDPYLLRDGRKSFPSGHSALSCSAFVFLTFYLIGQLGILLPRGRGRTWRIIVAAAPSFLALLICLSRYSDYRHHWQDVLVGGLLGCVIAWFAYHQYFPALSHNQAHRPLEVLNGSGLTMTSVSGSSSPSSKSADNTV